MKKKINKKLVMSIEDNEDFQNSNEYLISDNFHVVDDVKVRDHYHIIRKYRCFVQRDSNVNFKLNHISQPKKL